jgi:23S rRNA (guanine745-N1)-methyltransferase
METEKPSLPGAFQSNQSDPLLCCPVCDGHIARSETLCTCEQGHSFDVARHGYVNLLLPHQRNSKQPGDSREMVQARSRLLNEGYYQPISDALNKVISTQLLASDATTAARVLDVGCGEGYYLARLHDTLSTDPLLQKTVTVGLDISKEAIRGATHRTREVTWIVASVIKMPLQSASFRLIMSVFAPTSLDEFARLLEPGGKLVLVTPGPNHLYALRQLLYNNVVEHSQEDFLERANASFTLLRSERVTFNIHLRNTGDILNLFHMTPYFWKSSSNSRLRVEELDQLETQVDVSMRVFQF